MFYFERLSTQLDQLLRDADTLEFISEELFDHYADPVSRGVTLPRLAPLLENLLRTQGRSAASRDVQRYWDLHASPGRSVMGSVEFGSFVRTALEDLLRVTVCVLERRKREAQEQLTRRELELGLIVECSGGVVECEQPELDGGGAVGRTGTADRDNAGWTDDQQTSLAAGRGPAISATSMNSAFGAERRGGQNGAGDRIREEGEEALALAGRINALTKTGSAGGTDAVLGGTGAGARAVPGSSPGEQSSTGFTFGKTNDAARGVPSVANCSLDLESITSEMSRHLEGLEDERRKRTIREHQKSSQQHRLNSLAATKKGTSSKNDHQSPSKAPGAAGGTRGAGAQPKSLQQLQQSPGQKRRTPAPVKRRTSPILEKENQNPLDHARDHPHHEAGPLTDDVIPPPKVLTNREQDELDRRRRVYAKFRGQTITHSAEEAEALVAAIASDNGVFLDPDFSADNLIPNVPGEIRWVRASRISKELSPPGAAAGGASSGSTSSSGGAPVSETFPFGRQTCEFRLAPSNSIGDSWFVGAVALLASKNRIFGSAIPVSLCRAAQNGIITCRFFKDGGFVFVTIDDRVPFLQAVGLDGVSAVWQPLGADAFRQKSASPCGGDLGAEHAAWLYLLEKAYAKYFGGYARLPSGFPDEALLDLTGCAVEKVTLSKTPNPQKLFVELQSRLKNDGGGVVGCIKMEPGSSLARSARDLDEARYIHVEGRKIGLSGGGLINTGLLRNTMYAVESAILGAAGVVRVEGAGASSSNKPERVILLRSLTGAFGRWGGRAPVVDLSQIGPAARDDPSLLAVYLDDFLQVFGNCFLLLDRLTTHFPCEKWTVGTCGGTPIPVRQPVPGTVATWATNPQFLVTIPSCQSGTQYLM